MGEDMTRYFAQWYEPTQHDAWGKAHDALSQSIGRSHADAAIAALRRAEFDVTWPFWDVAARPSMTHCWIRGYAPDSDDILVAGVFDTTGEETVRSEIGAHAVVEIGARPAGWLPEDQALHLALQDHGPTRIRHAGIPVEIEDDIILDEAPATTVVVRWSMAQWLKKATVAWWPT